MRTPEHGRKEPMTLHRARELREEARTMRDLARLMGGPYETPWVQSCDKRIANLDRIIAQRSAMLPGVLVGAPLERLETGTEPTGGV